MLRICLKLILALLLPVMASSSVHAQIQLNGKRVVCDTGRGLWLCSIAESDFGRDLPAVITFDSTLVALSIDGREIASGDSIVLPPVQPDTKLPLVATRADHSTVSGNLQFTFLPIIEFGGTFNRTTFTTVPFNIMRPDDEDIMARAKVRYRGSLTYYNAPDKRGFHVKFVDDNDEKLELKLFGLRNDNTWNLEGGGADLMRIRNYVAAGLWNDMAVKPYYADQEPKALSATRGQLVEMFLNGGYVGLYHMCEPIDRKQMKLKKYDPETLEIHGQLWKSDNRSAFTLMDTVPARLPNGNNANYNFFETKYPDLDEVKPTNYTALYELGKLCANADDETFAAQIADRLDIPVIIDYYIFCEALLAFDNEGKNVYWACYDRTQSEKLTLGVWDLDVSFGQDWRAASMHSSRVQPWADFLFWYGNHHRFLTRLYELNVDNFRQKVNDRYRELRQSELTTEAIMERFNTTLEMLKRSGTAAREEWRHAPDLFSKQNINFDEELAYIADWLPRRFDYLDNYIFVEKRIMRGDINDDGIIDVVDVNGIINMILGTIELTPIGDYDYSSIVDVSDINKMINDILGIVPEEEE
ncbi:MAG: CotH kinase family protein [Muribaculaceae bacterium]|nr:CotH kinase family protein [Muribaculaceae bacterium]